MVRWSHRGPKKQHEAILIAGNVSIAERSFRSLLRIWQRRMLHFIGEGNWKCQRWRGSIAIINCDILDRRRLMYRMMKKTKHAFIALELKAAFQYKERININCLLQIKHWHACLPPTEGAVSQMFIS